MTCSLAFEMFPYLQPNFTEINNEPGIKSNAVYIMVSQEALLLLNSISFNCFRYYRGAKFEL